LLLSAWNSGELARLESALTELGRAVTAPSLSCEAERMEMVSEIAATIQGWIDRSRNQTDLEMSLRLLRHLASSEQAATEIVRAGSSAHSPGIALKDGYGLKEAIRPATPVSAAR